MDASKIAVLQARVISNQLVAQDTRRIQLSAPLGKFPWENVDPGKFVCLAPLSEDSSMARPFSIFDASMSRETFTILYKAVGKNTTAMAKLHKGSKVKVWGPLGNNFQSDYSAYDEIWLVGGGIGIAPLNFFDRRISERSAKITRVFYGCKNKEEIIPFPIYTQAPVILATDDGSEGFHGFITTLLARYLEDRSGQKILVITCGPNLMMRKVAAICQETGIDCYVILETIMACGLGVCLGCSIKTASGMKRICHDGPVFPAKEVIWDELS